MLLGVQISTAGKIYEAPERAYRLGCNTMQIFSRNPQRWRRDSSLSSEDIAEFKLRQEKFKIRPVFIHLPYLMNLASPDSRLYNASISAYIEDILEAHILQADFIVTHMGSHKNTSESSGLKRLTKALNKIMERTKSARVGILLENTAGSGSWLGYEFSHQKKVFQNIVHKERLGICLDTAHAYLAGYNIATKDGLEKMLEEIEKNVGLDKLRLIHLNDAKDKLNTHRDRHEHIGKGFIGMEGMKRIINHPQLESAAFILETPKTNPGDDEMNLQTVKNLRSQP